MPRAALTKTEIREFRNDLCAAAEKLFAEDGYRGVTLRAIASAIGTSPMAPYRYFRNKNEIFQAVRAAAFGRFADRQEAVFRSTDDPVERLYQLAHAYLDFARDERNAYRIMFELHPTWEPEIPELSEQQERAWRPLLDAVTAAIDSGILDGAPETVAHLFWAGLHGIVTLELAGKLRGNRTFDDLAEPMLEVLFRGTLAPPTVEGEETAGASAPSAGPRKETS